MIVETTVLTLSVGSSDSPSAPAESIFCAYWAPTACPWEVASHSTRGWRWSRLVGSHLSGHPARSAHRLVQSSTTSRQCPSIGGPRRNQQPRRSNSAPWLHRLSNCLGVHALGRRRSARAQSSACRWPFLPASSPTTSSPAKFPSRGQTYPNAFARLTFIERLLDKTAALPGSTCPPAWSTMSPSAVTPAKAPPP